MATASPRARLLWADDLAGQRVVVAAPADGSGSGGTLVRVWAGSRGADPASLTPVELVRDRVALVDDVVALAVEAGVADEDGAGAVLLLARPMVLQASYSALVSYERHGEVDRRWTEVALRDGVATVSIRGPMPPTFRVRVDGYDGGPLGVVPLGAPRPGPVGTAGRVAPRGDRPVRGGVHRPARVGGAQHGGARGARRRRRARAGGAR